MSVRYALLALLRREPMHGYQLKVAFEGSTGGTWPLNIGQVYTTLARLERDGCARPLADGDRAQRPYEITDAGRADLDAWFATPVERTDRPRDELAIKLALALATPGVDIAAVVGRQRTATMRSLQEYTRLKAAADGPADLSWRLVLDAMLFQAEAEIRWLDHCEASLLRHATRPAAGPPATRPAAGPPATRPAAGPPATRAAADRPAEPAIATGEARS
jgi:DNA-binding PadR family transcriptional regulator